MTVELFKGLVKGASILKRDISGYNYGDGRLSVSLTGGILNENIKNGELFNILITDEVNGNIEKIAKYISYNFVVFDNPTTGEKNVIGDNTILFELIE